MHFKLQICYFLGCPGQRWPKATCWILCLGYKEKKLMPKLSLKDEQKLTQVTMGEEKGTYLCKGPEARQNNVHLRA